MRNFGTVMYVCTTVNNIKSITSEGQFVRSTASMVNRTYIIVIEQISGISLNRLTGLLQVTPYTIIIKRPRFKLGPNKSRKPIGLLKQGSHF